MNKHRVFVTLLIIVLVLVSLSIIAKPAKAYGNSTIAVACPNIAIWATSDHPITSNILGQNYLIIWFQNYTTGLSTFTWAIYPASSETIVTASGSTYIRYSYAARWNLGDLSGHRWVSIGDNYSFELRDATGSVGKISGVCTGSSITSNSTPPGYILKTIICPAYILTSPAGPVIPTTSAVPMPEVGKQRYVLLVGAVGSDGQVYDKIQADAVTFGFFPRHCLA